MIKPFAADFLARAISHSLLYIVAFLVCIERIKPHKYRASVLRAELRLTVYRPGEIPVVRAVLYGDNAARCDLSFARVTLADVHYVADYFLVRGLNGCAHPVCCVCIAAECVGIAELAVLRLSGDRLPHIP